MEQLPMKETVDLRTILATIWHRKFVVAVPVVLAALTAWIVTLPQIMVPQYQCQSVLLVQPPPQLSFQLAGIVVNPSQTEQIIRIQSQIRSNEFLDKVITQTRLREAGPFREWARRNRDRYAGMTEDQLVDLRAKEFLRRSVIASLSGTRSGPANQVTISLQMADPDQVFALVNNITRSVIDAGKSELSEEFQWTSAFSEIQRQEFQTRLDKAEKELEEFQRQHMARQATPGIVGETNVGLAQQLRDGAAADLATQEREVDRLGESLRQEGVDPGAVERVLAAPEAAAGLSEARTLERDYIRALLGNARDAQGTAIQSARRSDEVGQAARAALRLRRRQTRGNRSGRAVPRRPGAPRSGADAREHAGPGARGVSWSGLRRARSRPAAPAPPAGGGLQPVDPQRVRDADGRFADIRGLWSEQGRREDQCPRSGAAAAGSGLAEADADHSPRRARRPGAGNRRCHLPGADGPVVSRRAGDQTAIRTGGPGGDSQHGRIRKADGQPAPFARRSGPRGPPGRSG